MSAMRRATAKTFAALKVPNYRKYFFGQMVSASGTWMQSVAQGWLVLQISSGNAFYLGVAVALSSLPILLFGALGGLVADRCDKRRIMLCTQSAAGLLAATLGLLTVTHHVTVYEVFALAFLLGVVNLFDVPARQAFVHELVGRELLANAVGLNSVLMNSGRLIGPAVAAAVIGTAGLAACFFLNAASYVAVLAALTTLRHSEMHHVTPIDRERGQLREGLRYVRHDAVLWRVLLAVAVVGTFAFNFTVTLPMLAERTFHDHQATGYGLLMASMGVGAVIGGLLVAWRSRPGLRVLGGAGVLFGLSMAVVALAANLYMAAGALVVVGASSIGFTSTAISTLQTRSRSQMRGRVMSLQAMAFMGSTPIGAPLMGALGGLFSPRVALLVGALFTLATGLWLEGHRRARDAARDAQRAAGALSKAVAA